MRERKFICSKLQDRLFMQIRADYLFIFCYFHWRPDYLFPNITRPEYLHVFEKKIPAYPHPLRIKWSSANVHAIFRLYDNHILCETTRSFWVLLKHFTFIYYFLRQNISEPEVEDQHTEDSHMPLRCVCVWQTNPSWGLTSQILQNHLNLLTQSRVKKTILEVGF